MQSSKSCEIYSLVPGIDPIEWICHHYATNAFIRPIPHVANGAIQVLCNAVGDGGVSFPEKKRYEGSTLLALRGGGWWSNSHEKKSVM